MNVEFIASALPQLDAAVAVEQRLSEQAAGDVAVQEAQASTKAAIARSCTEAATGACGGDTFAELVNSTKWQTRE